jgi:catecholate siderophore receptor
MRRSAQPRAVLSRRNRRSPLVARAPPTGLTKAAEACATPTGTSPAGWGLYVQDLVTVAPHWKLLAGLRYDRLTGDYSAYAVPNNAVSPVTTTSYRMKVSELSKRLGVLFQPDDRQTYHLSLANSFNTSGDAYSLSASNVDTPPEQAINVELGGRIDSADKRFTTRFALFRSTKLHERNTDPLVNLTTLSGRRHVAGAEIDISGRLTPKWEIFGSYMWLPEAHIDTCRCTGGETGRPSLTPKHSGTVWTTYQITPLWRIGGGLEFPRVSRPPTGTRAGRCRATSPPT